jgi:hypothetical protein
MGLRACNSAVPSGGLQTRKLRLGAESVSLRRFQKNIRDGHRNFDDDTDDHNDDNTDHDHDHDQHNHHQYYHRHFHLHRNRHHEEE